jgi:hypothetical protein
MADRLIIARGEMSQYRLTLNLRARLGKFGENEISKFERMQKQTISATLLIAICEELNTSIECIIYGKN